MTYANIKQNYCLVNEILTGGRKNLNHDVGDKVSSVQGELCFSMGEVIL